jgi:hypothetical protein
MSPSPETRLFSSFWDDGVLDLVAGAAVALIGLGYMVEQYLVVAVVLPLGLTVWLLLRKRLVEPRAGYVEFSRGRRALVRRELLGAVALGGGLFAMILVLLGMSDRLPGLGELGDAVPALLMAMMAVMAAGLTRAWRFVGYATLLAAGGVGTALVAGGPWLPLMIGGLVALVIGAVLLARFLAASRRFLEAE